MYANILFDRFLCIYILTVKLRLPLYLLSVYESLTCGGTTSDYSRATVDIQIKNSLPLAHLLIDYLNYFQNQEISIDMKL